MERIQQVRRRGGVQGGAKYSSILDVRLSCCTSGWPFRLCVPCCVRSSPSSCCRTLAVCKQRPHAQTHMHPTTLWEAELTLLPPLLPQSVE